MYLPVCEVCMSMTAVFRVDS